MKALCLIVVLLVISTFSNTSPATNTFTARNLEITGNTLGSPIVVSANDFGRTSPFLVNITNLSTNRRWVGLLNPGDVAGSFSESFNTICGLTSPNTNPPTISAAPYDVIEVSWYDNTGLKWANFTTMVFMEEYQSQMGTAERVSKVLLETAVKKGISKLSKLRERLLFIKNNLPAYEESGCCSTEDYVYPLNLMAVVQASYVFLRGKKQVEPVGAQEATCTSMSQFKLNTETFYAEGLGKVDFRWTGVGGTGSWQDPRNWWPARVPNSRNAVVHLSSTHSQFVHLEGDVYIHDLQINGKIRVDPGPFLLQIASKGQGRTARRIWYGKGGSWTNPARWSPMKIPTMQDIVVLAGFGTVDITSTHDNPLAIYPTSVGAGPYTTPGSGETMMVNNQTGGLKIYVIDTFRAPLHGAAVICTTVETVSFRTNFTIQRPFRTRITNEDGWADFGTVTAGSIYNCTIPAYINFLSTTTGSFTVGRQEQKQLEIVLGL